MPFDLLTLSQQAQSVLALLATYALHSTLLFAAAWIATRFLSAPRLRELLWKGALVGGLVTTGVRARLGSSPLAVEFAALTAKSGLAHGAIMEIAGSRSAQAVEEAIPAGAAPLEIQAGAGVLGVLGQVPSAAALWPLWACLVWWGAAVLGLWLLQRQRRRR